MPSTIQRPAFFEGQILGANDLQQSLDYARDENARHERYLHSWGIAEGLSVDKRGDVVVLLPGFAIDSSGAPIIVPEPVVLDPQQLRAEALLSKDDKEGFFPVFVARAESDQSNEQLIGHCSTGAATRRSESFAVTFRRIATGWDEDQHQAPPAISSGPEDASQSNRVVLIGFVEWSNEDDGNIVGFERRRQDIIPRYAGVRADDLLGRGGTLTLRTRRPKKTDAPMVVVDDHSDENTFVLGLDDGQGHVNEVFAVDAKGNVRAKGDIEFSGSLKGTITSGQVFIESGAASDGSILPLAGGVRSEQIADGSVALHISVTPRINWSNQPDAGWGPFVLECSVNDERRVTCTTRWMKMAGSAGTFPIDFVDSVDYFVSVTVPPPGESS